jgi:hypothetical protein
LRKPKQQKKTKTKLFCDNQKKHEKDKAILWMKCNWLYVNVTLLQTSNYKRTPNINAIL